MFALGLALGGILGLVLAIIAVVLYNYWTKEEGDDTPWWMK
jgi:biopolymer transport protein ExbB/TolQ